MSSVIPDPPAFYHRLLILSRQSRAPPTFRREQYSGAGRYIIIQGQGTTTPLPGVYLAMDGQFGEATTEFEKALRLDPTSSYLVLELATLLPGMGETGKALTLSRKIPLGKSRQR